MVRSIQQRKGVGETMMPLLMVIIALAFALALLAYVWIRRAKVGSGKKLHVAFVHPDLGIGGAERLVVDAAVGLQSLGHSVVMYTSHHDPRHAFPETRNGTLTVKVGDMLFPWPFDGASASS